MVEADIEIGKELIQPYEIINYKFNKKKKKWKEIKTKVKAIYDLREVVNG